MAERKHMNFKEFLRIIVGAIRPELRKIAQDFVKVLPEGLRKEWVGRFMGSLAQFVEKSDIFGIQETISDMIEITADEVAKQIKKPKEEIKEKIGAKRIEEIFAKQLEEATRKIAEAENIENEKERQKAIITAETEIFKTYLEAISELTKSTQEQVEIKEGKKIDWKKVFNEIKKALNKTWEKAKEETPKGYQKTKEAVKTMDQKAEELADKIAELRKKLRKTDLL
jgi:hypothetical protein